MRYRPFSVASTSAGKRQQSGVIREALGGTGVCTRRS